MTRVCGVSDAVRLATAARSLARCLARISALHRPRMHEKPHFKPFRPQERLRPGDEMELHRGALVFEFPTGSKAAAGAPASPERDAREEARRYCLAGAAGSSLGCWLSEATSR
jgi:hypothetical protein